MKTFEEWWDNTHPPSTRILACKEAYEYALANAIDLTKEEWEELEISKDSISGRYESNTRLENILDKLGLQALELRGRKKK